MVVDNKLEELRREVKVWEKKYRERFKRERKSEAEFACDSGIPVRRVYTPLDLEEKGFDYTRDLGMPGEYPYTRGITPGGYREALWRITQVSGYATPEDSNKLWKEQCEAGLNSAYIAYDLPCQLGLDPDNPRAEGEVGRVGVSLVSQRDWEIAFDGIDVGNFKVIQVANAHGAIGIANHLCLARKQKVPYTKLTGICQNDILKEYVARGNYIFPPEPSLRLVTDTLYYCAKNVPKYQPIEVCSAHYSESQATPVHDAAFCLADAFAYLQSAAEHGVDIDLVAPGMGVIVGNDHYGFFQEIAKVRAMRKIYATTMKERFKVKKPESMMMALHIGQGGNSLQRKQYLNNIARITLANLAAALVGSQHINLRTYDEQFGIPTQEAMVQNIRIQHVIAQETGVCDTVDPLGGSYFVEWLTAEFEERINIEIEKIDRQGGVVKCIENGYIKKILVRDAYKWQRDFESGKVIRVGANFYPSDEEEKPLRIYRTSPGVEQSRKTAVQELKQKRDNRKVKKALDEVKATASLPGTPENNLMPAIIEAVDSYATVQEISDVFRQVWGEYKEPSIF
ncbi:MAG: methylmalonyl-CoA mutase family protein [Dehalococcoidales bacterium]|nr:methylmalonyl-CoA mutase family protein [Dehalococcoidales bacterium]